MNRREWILRGTYVGLWVLILARMLSLMPTDGGWGGWDADMAIPLLQVNDPVFDPFRLYYYAQDRLGAWPWLLMHGVRPPWLDGGWTLADLLLWHTLGTCAACFPLLALHRVGGQVLAAAYVVLLLLLPGPSVPLMFAVGFSFGWQILAMFAAWWALEHMLTALIRHESRTRTTRWAAGASLFAALACWSSPTSGPMLLAFLSVWGLVLAVQLPTARERWRLLWGVLPVGLGILTEVVIRNRYHLHARKLFGSGFGTDLRVDVGYLGENFRAVGERLLTIPPGPVVLAGWLVSLASLAWLLRHVRTLGAHPERTRLAALTLMFTAGSVANALLTVMVAHVRQNDYSPRYLVPTFMLGGMAAALGVLFVLTWVPGLRSRVGPLGAVYAASLLLGGYALARKPDPPRPFLEQSRAIADALVRDEPGDVLLGGYWEAYPVGALAHQRRLPVMASEGGHLRTPFWLDTLRQGPGALLMLNQGAEAGTAPAPPWLFQYGTVLRLTQAHHVVVPPFQVARYENLTRSTVPVRLEPARGFDPCAVGTELTVHFERPVTRGLLLVGSRTPPEGIDAAAPGVGALRVEGDLGVWRVRVEAGQPIDRVTLRVRERGTGEVCELRGAALVTGESLDGAPR